MESNQNLKSNIKDLNKKNKTLEFKMSKKPLIISDNIYLDFDDKLRQMMASNSLFHPNNTGTEYFDQNISNLKPDIPELPKSATKSFVSQDQTTQFHQTHQTAVSGANTKSQKNRHKIYEERGFASPHRHERNLDEYEALCEIRRQKYVSHLEKLQRKIFVLYSQRKKGAFERKALAEEVRNMKKGLKANRKFMKLMKQEMKHLHNQNKILLEEKKRLEEGMFMKVYQERSERIV